VEHFEWRAAVETSRWSTSLPVSGVGAVVCALVSVAWGGFVTVSVGTNLTYSVHNWHDRVSFCLPCVILTLTSWSVKKKDTTQEKLKMEENVFTNQHVCHSDTEKNNNNYTDAVSCQEMKDKEVSR